MSRKRDLIAKCDDIITISRLKSDLCDRGISLEAALNLFKEKEEEIALLKNEHDETSRKPVLDQKQRDEMTSEAARLAEEIATLKEKINDDDLAERIASDCRDPAHDNRWCPTCEARRDGIDDYQQALKEGKR